MAPIQAESQVSRNLNDRWRLHSSGGEGRMESKSSKLYPNANAINV
jgi:hypothetical protein